MTERAQIERAVDEFYAYAHELLARGASDPGDDLSRRCSPPSRTAKAVDDECVNLVLNILVGGVDTTQRQLAHAMRLFAEHPDQWALLRARSGARRRGGRGGPALRADHAVHRAHRARGHRVPRRDVPGGDGRAGRRASTPTATRLGRRPTSFDITRRARRRAPQTFGAGHPLLPGREPGAGRAEGGARVPRPAHARLRARRRARVRRRQRHLRARRAAVSLHAA